MKAAWRTLPLEKACEFIVDGDWIESKDQGGRDYRLLQVSNVARGSFRETGNFRWITEATFNRLGCTRIEPGHVLIARMPEPTGRAWFVSALPWPAITSVDVAIAMPSTDVMDGRFLAYCLNSPKQLQAVAAQASGTTRTRITRRVLAQMPVPVPPLQIQKKIVETLAAYDELIENNLRRIEILEEMAQAVYREWFVNFRFPGHEHTDFVDSALGQTPAGWEASTVGRATENFDRLRKPLSKMQRAEIPGKYPYYGAARVFDHVNDYIFDGHYLLVAEDGSVITTDGHPVLQLAYGKFWANNHTHVLRGSLVSTDYLFLALRRCHVTGYVTGAAQPKITQAALNRIPLIIPPPTTQQQFDGFVGPLFALRRNLLDQNTNVRATRDLLLPKLVSGEIDVSDLDIDTEWLAS